MLKDNFFKWVNAEPLRAWEWKCCVEAMVSSFLYRENKTDNPQTKIKRKYQKTQKQLQRKKNKKKKNTKKS